MGRVTRWLRHLFAPSARDRFPDASLDRIADAAKPLMDALERLPR